MINLKDSIRDFSQERLTRKWSITAVTLFAAALLLIAMRNIWIPLDAAVVRLRAGMSLEQVFYVFANDIQQYAEIH